MLQSQTSQSSITKQASIGMADQLTSQSQTTNAEPRKHRFKVELVPEPQNGIAAQPQVAQQQTSLQGNTMHQNIREKSPVEVQQQNPILAQQTQAWQLERYNNENSISLQQASTVQKHGGDMNMLQLVKQQNRNIIVTQGCNGNSYHQVLPNTLIQTHGSNTNVVQQQLNPIIRQELNVNTFKVPNVKGNSANKCKLELSPVIQTSNISPVQSEPEGITGQTEGNRKLPNQINAQQSKTKLQTKVNGNSPQQQASPKVQTPRNVSPEKQLEYTVNQQQSIATTASLTQQKQYTATELTGNQASSTVQTPGNLSPSYILQSVNQNQLNVSSSQQQLYNVTQMTGNVNSSQLRGSPIVQTPGYSSPVQQVLNPVDQQQWKSSLSQQPSYIATQMTVNLNSSQQKDSANVQTPGYDVSPVQQILYPFNQQQWTASPCQQQPYNATQITGYMNSSQQQASPTAQSPGYGSPVQQVISPINQQQWSESSSQQQPYIATQVTGNGKSSQEQASPTFQTPGYGSPTQQVLYPVNQQQWSASLSQQQPYIAAQLAGNLNLSQQQGSPTVQTPGNVSPAQQLFHPLNPQQLTESLSQQQFCTVAQMTENVNSSHQQTNPTFQTPGIISPDQQLIHPVNQQQWSASSSQQQPYIANQMIETSGNVNSFQQQASPTIVQSPVNLSPPQQLLNPDVQPQWNSNSFQEQPNPMYQQLYPPVQQQAHISTFQPMKNSILQSDLYVNQYQQYYQMVQPQPNENSVQQVFKPIAQPLENVNSFQQLWTPTMQTQEKDQHQPVYEHNGINNHKVQQALSTHEHNGIYNQKFQQVEPVYLCQSPILAQGITPTQPKHDSMLPNHDYVENQYQSTIPLKEAQSEINQHPSNVSQTSTQVVHSDSKSLKHTLQLTSLKEKQQKSTQPTMGNLTRTREKLLPTISENEILIIESGPFCSTIKNGIPKALEVPISQKTPEKSIEMNKNLTIDYKIDKSIDLVKKFVRVVVGDEIESYQKKIGELEKQIFALQAENDFLKQNASAHTLAQLQALRSRSEKQPKSKTNSNK